MAVLLLAVLFGDVTSNGVFEYDPLPHGVATAGMYLVVGIAETAVKPALLGGLACPLDASQSHCDAKRLWELDQTVVGNHSPTWRRISDVGMFAAVLLPVGAAFADNYAQKSPRLWHDAGLDILLGLESVALATFINTTLKFAVRRPRPWLYSHGGTSVEQDLSFPSGHTAATAAGLTSYVTTFFLRHPTNPWRFAVLGAGTVMLGATSYGRAAGGMHFYSDILAGAALGIGVGFAVPYLLRQRVTVQPWVQAVPYRADTRYYGLQLAWQTSW